ncbi:CRISPR-associated endonuclease Cas6 [Hymenobacter arizonensis]|uniref:DNA repair protein n=1 Tax=Hymenobacter arizonensis TaxID=1227077 RepID=A0A1I6BGU6_HYMAR|nr:CRISPR-associated endonuclease Cas6 [Hymenobacter arizonensis]SFQ80165.1 hypothetical protein SAMN04515668_4549 [Hymenobacter arizonensis]
MDTRTISPSSSATTLTPNSNSTLLADSVRLATITFPGIRLQPRDAHKLRGYLGGLFRDHSPLLHNHFDDGTYRQHYPLVQYKVLNEVATLVGLNEGAAPLVQLFLHIRELDLAGKRHPVLDKHIRHESAAIGLGTELYRYRFVTRWLPLNQGNHRDYQALEPAARRMQLTRILTNNILALLKAANVYAPQLPRLMVHLALSEPVLTQFKNQPMLGFGGEFVANVVLPDGLGLGKSVARGFGSVQRLD